MALNLVALGATGLGLRALFPDGAPSVAVFAPWPVPLLADAPLLGSVLFRHTAFVYAAFALALGVGVFLARTRAGLRLRAVGEAARAADAEGVRVDAVRFAAVVFGAACAGLAGASLALAQSNTFTEGMTAGRGFIALAIVIFGRFRAEGVLGAALFFGLANALQFRLQARGLGLPYPLFLAFPYLVTLAVLALSTRAARAPAELGRPYRREARTLR
jgi:simple sugar transport system permease protein